MPWKRWENLSWGEKAKQMYPDTRGFPTSELKKTLNLCMSEEKEKCKSCPLGQKNGTGGCHDQLYTLFYNRLRSLRDYEENTPAKDLARNFEVCFSGGLPERCWKCDYNYRKAGCWKDLLKKAMELIEREENPSEK